MPASRLAEYGITDRTWADAMRSGGLIGFTASQQGELLGYCFGDTASGEVVVLALLPQAEGRGLGRELLGRVVAELQRLGHTRVFLGCSSDSQARSHGFYRHLGWRPTGATDAHGDEVLALSLGPATPPAG